MDPFVYVPADDPLFGAVGIELDHEAGTLGVSGGGLPTVEIRRAPGTPLETHVPIGTRDPGRLTLLVDGAEETLRPAKGFLTRRSYRVEVVSGTRQCGHLLVPDSLGTSRLLRDGRRLGVFTSTGDGKVTAEWETGNGAKNAPEPYDASVGYALAAAFGTGAEPMWKLTLDAALDLWP
ncbi:hypothetical protein ACFVZC_02105 [Streptomyces marokkonensis]|uniref:Uncharacterized protein n=1 Tax=Streptomyces marokkonensis TaxID=324855 RepID=A0ABW6PZ58_9ACTN|nr:hypothetical protein [Streptomyces marokkonensis]